MGEPSDRYGSEAGSGHPAASNTATGSRESRQWAILPSLTVMMDANVVWPAGLHGCAVHLVFKNRHRRIAIPVDAEIVGGMDGHVVVVTAVQVNDPSTTFDTLGIARHRDDVLEEDVIVQKIEEVLPVRPPIQTLTNNAEKGSVGPEVRLLVDELGHRSSQVVELMALLGPYPANVAKVQWLPSGSSTVKSRDE